MNTGDLFNCVIVVAWDGTAVLFSAPKPVTDRMMGCFLDENPWCGFPEEPGAYNCIVKIVCDDSYARDGGPTEDGDILFSVQETEQIG